MAFERPFKITIADGSKRISFGPRRPNEIGRDILAVKVALGLVRTTQSESESPVEASGEDQPSASVALDGQNWFDCGSGLGMDIRQASTYDSRLRNALVNYQIQNQFLIVCYLIQKYGLKEIISQSRASLEFGILGSNIPDEYNKSLLMLIESTLTLFDAELGLLGEATIAVMHGWRPHTTITNSGYFHLDMPGIQKVIDIIHVGLSNYLSDTSSNAGFGQKYSDMVRQGICTDGGWSMNDRQMLRIYKQYASDNSDWLEESSDYQFAAITYVKRESDSPSILYSAATEVMRSIEEDSGSPVYGPDSQSSSERIENLKRMYFPDPFTDPPPFEIDDDRIGFFLETEYELKSDNLPSEDIGVLEVLEQAALEKVFTHYNKPEMWFINKSEELSFESNLIERNRLAFFAGGTAPEPEHNGYYPFPADILQQLGRVSSNPEEFDLDFLKYESYKNLKYRFDFNKKQRDIAQEKLLDIEPFSDRHRPAFYEATGPAVDFEMGSRMAWNESDSRDDINERYNAAQASIIEAKQAWPGADRSKENFYVLSLKSDDLVSQNYAQHWREIDSIGTQEPLIQFVEYRTPSLRPMQKYRALFYINKRKLDLITDSVLVQEASTQSSTSDSDSLVPQVCADDNSSQTRRRYQEYKAHAIRTRNEIVKKFREESKKLNYQNDFDSARLDLGTHGPFDLNDAFNPFGGGMVSGQAYTEKVFSKLFGEEDSVLSGLGVVGTDMEQMQSIINETDPLKTTDDGFPDGSGTEIAGGEYNNSLKITLGELEERINIMVEDLLEAGKEIKSGGIVFEPGSNFDAKKEANYVEEFLINLDLMFFDKNENAFENPQTEIIFKFAPATKIYGSPEAKIGPKVGKILSKVTISVPPTPPDPSSETNVNISAAPVVNEFDELEVLGYDLDRPRTINYISRIYDMTTRYLPAGSYMKSFFEDARGSCKDLGIDIKKTLGVSYIGKYTSGLKVTADESQSAFEAVRKWSDSSFVDPFNDWVSASAKNARASNPADPQNDFFDEKAALKMMGEMCEWEDVYEAIFDKLDLASLLCDYIKCIKLPGFDIKLPSFYLPPLPKIPIIGWMAEIYKFLVENFDQIINRLLCTAAKLIIDKLTIPFCEEQLREFIAAGSSAGPLWNEALADSLLLTGFSDQKREEAKDFFEDSTSILTNEELCRLLKGQTLDRPTIMAVLKLAQNRGLDMEIRNEEDITNFFGVIYQYLPGEICEALESPQYLIKDCEDSLDPVSVVRSRLLSDDPNMPEEKLNSALDIARQNRENVANELKAFSGSDLDSLAPSFFEMGNPAAMVSDYPPYLKEQLSDSMKAVFEPARSSYVSTLNTFIPAMRVLSPFAPRAGDEEYEDLETMQLESAIHQLSSFSYYSSIDAYEGMSLERLERTANQASETLQGLREQKQRGSSLLNNVIRTNRQWYRAKVNFMESLHANGGLNSRGNPELQDLASRNRIHHFTAYDVIESAEDYVRNSWFHPDGQVLRQAYHDDNSAGSPSVDQYDEDGFDNSFLNKINRATSFSSVTTDVHREYVPRFFNGTVRPAIRPVIAAKKAFMEACHEYYYWARDELKQYYYRSGAESQFWHYIHEVVFNNFMPPRFRSDSKDSGVINSGRNYIETVHKLEVIINGGQGLQNIGNPTIFKPHNARVTENRQTVLDLSGVTRDPETISDLIEEKQNIMDQALADQNPKITYQMLSLLYACYMGSEIKKKDISVIDFFNDDTYDGIFRRYKYDPEFQPQRAGQDGDVSYNTPLPPVILSAGNRTFSPWPGRVNPDPEGLAIVGKNIKDIPSNYEVGYEEYIDSITDPQDISEYAVKIRGISGASSGNLPWLSTTGILYWKYVGSSGLFDECPDPFSGAKRAAVKAETKAFYEEYKDEEPGSPKIMNAVVGRIKELTNLINDLLQKRSTNNIELHLPLIKEAFKWSSESSRENSTPAGSPGGSREGFVRYNAARNEVELNFKAGVYSPTVIMKEHQKNGYYDRYDITVKGDFFLNQDPEDSVVFKYCDEVPASEVENKLDLGERVGNNFTKREAWASFLFNKMASQFNSPKRADQLSTAEKQEILRLLSENNFEQVTEKTMEQVIFSLYNSRFFETDYSDELDDRISGNPIYKQSCVTNSLGLSDASSLAFDKVILGDPAVEIAIESSRPENSPFNRDFDTPGPFEKAMKTVAVKAFIRACLVEMLLKGGIAYASWDIESVSSEPFFIDYVLHNIESELNKNSNLRNLWKSTLEKSESISSPKEALKRFVTDEILKLPNYSKEIFNPDQPKRDFFEWELGDILPMIDYPSHASTTMSQDTGARWKGYRSWSRPPVCRKGWRSFHIEEYYYFQVPQSTKDRLEESGIRPWWNGPAPLNYFNNEWIESWTSDAFSRFKTISGLNAGAGLISAFNDFIGELLSGITAEHKVRLILIEQGSTDDDWSSGRVPHVKDVLQRVALKYFASSPTSPNGDPRNLYRSSIGARKGIVEVKFDTESGEYSSTWRRAVTVDLARAKRNISPSSCPALWSLDSTARNFKVFSGTKEEDTKRYMRKLLAETSDFQFVMNTVFPIRRFMAMSSMYSTSILSGYSAVPNVMRAAKVMISAIAKLSDTPRRMQEELIEINQSSFQDYIKKNFPSDPSDPSCFDFPGLGGDFFEKFFSDLWDLIKQLPSILLRGLAYQLDPAYKEMRSHYMNCDIDKLYLNRIAGSTVDKSLVNGLRVGKGGHGNNNGKYATLFSAPIDYYMSYTNPFKLPRRMEKTILKVISYVYSGGAPFVDLNTVFKIPCANIDENYLDGKKYDFGKYGRYGHPLGPFGLFALMTPELRMDKRMKQGKCRPIPTIPCEDLEDETT